MVHRLYDRGDVVSNMSRKMIMMTTTLMITTPMYDEPWCDDLDTTLWEVVLVDLSLVSVSASVSVSVCAAS